MEEQTFLAWWFYGDSEDSFFRAFFRTASVFALGVAAAPIVVPIVKDLGKSLFKDNKKPSPQAQQVAWVPNNVMNAQLGMG